MMRFDPYSDAVSSIFIIFQVHKKELFPEMTISNQIQVISVEWFDFSRNCVNEYWDLFYVLFVNSLWGEKTTIQLY